MAKKVDVKDFLAIAKRHSKTECPVALALKAAYDAGRVVVEGSHITIYDANDLIMSEGDIGEDLSDCIKHYDETGEWTGKDHLYVNSPYEYLTADNIPAVGTYHRE